LAGKYVRSADLGITWNYKTTNTADAFPQAATGLDPNYPSNMSLVNPQTNPGVDFSFEYNAQNYCKAIGGRLPNVQELIAIYVDKASYGNNFQVNSYWSATEYGPDSYFAYAVWFGNGVPGYSAKTYSGYDRCVSG
jgi:hypothetical protein